MAQIIISDTSCLILYDKIRRFDVLKATFEQIVATEEVENEYGDLPEWIEVKSYPLKKCWYFEGIRKSLVIAAGKQIVPGTVFWQK
ncbi:MAG: hypothetical protein EPO28_09275 [Saprospiraceae bacterium]|nr:MAG: hypothetical protein EPO28_09275 [Saprospiraceae bacterium]